MLLLNLQCGKSHKTNLKLSLNYYNNDDLAIQNRSTRIYMRVNDLKSPHMSV